MANTISTIGNFLTHAPHLQICNDAIFCPPSSGFEGLLPRRRGDHLHQRSQAEGWRGVSDININNVMPKIVPPDMTAVWIIFFEFPLTDLNLFSSLVEFAERRGMEYALEKLDDTELNGRRLRLVEESKLLGRGRSRSRSRSRSRWEILISHWGTFIQSYGLEILFCTLDQ